MITAGTQEDRIGGPRRGGAKRRGKQPLKPRNNRRIVATVCCVLLIAAIVGLVRDFEQVSHFINRPVTKVRMDNQWQRVSDVEVREILAPFMGAGFFNLDVAALKDELEAHDWIEQAAVKRLWPDSIAIHLSEEVALARWGEQGVLNQQGEVFMPADVNELVTLPRLSGPSGSQVDVMRRYQVISELLFRSGLRLTALDLSPRGSWQLSIDNDYTIVVGRDNVMDRLQRYVNFYRTSPELQAGPIESVDLRYDNGIAVNFVDTELAEVAAR